MLIHVKEAFEGNAVSELRLRFLWDPLTGRAGIILSKAVIWSRGAFGMHLSLRVAALTSTRYDGPCYMGFMGDCS